MNTRPNILLVMTDHQRADSIGMIQCGREVTPHLNRLLKEATHFTRTYNACPLCVPARTALATGIYPTENGVVYNDWKGVTSGNFEPFHKTLQHSGYYVGHSGIDHIRVKPRLSELGLDFFVNQENYNTWAKSLGIVTERNSEELTLVNEEVNGEYRQNKYSNHKVSLYHHPLETFKDFFFLEQSLRFLKERPSDRPFALFTYLWAPHPPLRVPEPYASMYNPEKIILPDNINTPSKGEPPLRRSGMPAQMAEHVTIDEWRKVWSAHLGLTTMADHIFGMLLDELKQQGVYDNTCILFTSDHGDHLGQHRMYQKMEMYEEAIHVPLILKLPKSHLLSAKHFTPLVSGVVSHLDIRPTLCELAEISSGTCDGQSLIPLAKGAVPDPERIVFSQYSGNPGYGTIRRAAITERYKYVYDGQLCHELYDLKEDPHEMHNLAENISYQEILKQLYTACRTYHEKRHDYFHWDTTQQKQEE